MNEFKMNLQRLHSELGINFEIIIEIIIGDFHIFISIPLRLVSPHIKLLDQRWTMMIDDSWNLTVNWINYYHYRLTAVTFCCGIWNNTFSNLVFFQMDSYNNNVNKSMAWLFLSIAQSAFNWMAFWRIKATLLCCKKVPFALICWQ